MKRFMLLSAGVAMSLMLAGCDVDVKKEGKLPSVDVDVHEGEMPDVDVRGPDVDVKMKETEVSVPDVDVKMEKKKISVPDVDVNIPKEEDNE